MKLTFGTWFTVIALCFCSFLLSCKEESNMFMQINSGESGITFNNTILENDSINPLDLTNIYNGGGVGIGDFNNDGLQDIYFTGNLVPNKLYLNKGDMKFEDITQKAGVDGNGRWSRGVSVIDINNDGLLDLYICTTIYADKERRSNLLYINKGVDNDKIPRFTESAREYGLDDTSFATMATFFDFDNDGDLDVYIAVNQIESYDNPSVFRPKITDGSHFSTGRLLRNSWNQDLHHPVYENVTKEAGLTIEGYAHAATVADFNKDGWKDIFITNDFVSNDILYINNKDGTFTDKAELYFKHTSANGMGQDVIDINNDGLADVIELDMNPKDNYRKKMMLAPASYQTYQNSEYFGYQYQYVRNTLQLNQGPRPEQNDSVGDPIFSEIGFLSGISETDWSWTPLVQDFDNDGNRDIFITNGYPKDVTDHDFIAFRKESHSISSKEHTLGEIPQVKISDYLFKNNGNLTFSDVTKEWGLNARSFSGGASYADLDNDGDLDIVVNNINDKASVYRNQSNSPKSLVKSHSLTIRLLGDSLNKNGLGAFIDVFADSLHLVYEQTPYRGYISSVSVLPHFGLGHITKIDSVIVRWPNGMFQKLENVPADSLLTVNINNARQNFSWETTVEKDNSIFKEVTASLGIDFNSTEVDFIDFNINKLSTHKFSEYGPGISVGDIDNSGTEDFFIGGSKGQPGNFFSQEKTGKFTRKELVIGNGVTEKIEEDLGSLLADFDNDGDLDLYVVSGGVESEEVKGGYQDRLYVNGGNWRFDQSPAAIPEMNISGCSVKGADYDNDGDIDLIRTGRVDFKNYPKAVTTAILRNDSKGGRIVFTDVTMLIAPFLHNVGMITDAVWSDFNQDGRVDLILCGEWMAPMFVKNTTTGFKDVSSTTGLDSEIGWWNSIAAADFDNDGDIDYVLGNNGLNSLYRASKVEPVGIYAKDFNKDGIFDAIPTVFFPDSNGVRKEYPAFGRDETIRQIVQFRKKFPKYRDYATAGIQDLFTPEELKGALVYKAYNLSSSYVENEGNGKFKMTSLPVEAQFAPIFGIAVGDFDLDGNLDMILNGNDYGIELSVGRNDALNGLMLSGDGQGGFKPLKMAKSGIFIPGNGKAIAICKGIKGEPLLVTTQNKGPVSVFESRIPQDLFDLKQNDRSVLIYYKNGKSRRSEVYFGNSFCSQSSRSVLVNSLISKIEITDHRGDKRMEIFK